jgi:hypothetical protein
VDDSDIEEENLAIFNVNVMVKTAEATKKQDAQRFTPAITVKLPVLTVRASLQWTKFLKVLAAPLKTSPTFFPMYTCEWKKTMAAKIGLPLSDEACFAALKCQFKPYGNHSFFLYLNLPNIIPNPGPLQSLAIEIPSMPTETVLELDIEQGSTIHTPVCSVSSLSDIAI